MHQFYIPNFPEQCTLSGDDSKHAVRVLRLKTTDTVLVTDGKGNRWLAKIIDDNQASVRLVLIEQLKVEPYEPYQLDLILAPPSHPDRLEWCVEKAVELGVRRIILLDADRLEYPKIKLERLERLIMAAFKQSQRLLLPSVTTLTPIDQVLKDVASATDKLICYLGEGTKPILEHKFHGGHIAIMIGPEGDFTANEIATALDAGFVPVSLGDGRLRTETAAMAVTAMIQALFAHN